MRKANEARCLLRFEDGPLLRPGRNSHRSRARHHSLSPARVARLEAAAAASRRLAALHRPAPAGTFVELLETDERAVIEAAIVHYRERFSTVGLYENEVYTDVPKGVAALREAGHRLWVVTSKPQVYARRIIEHFGLASLFQGVYGSELSGKNADKIELIAHVLESEQLDPARAWMIGDRAEDIRRKSGKEKRGTLCRFADSVDASDT